MSMEQLFDEVADMIQWALARIARPLRGVLQSTSASKPALAAHVSGLHQDEHTDLEVFQQYGVASVPPSGTEALVIFIGGHGEHPVVAGELDRSGDRPDDLAAGEVAIYSTGGGRVHCKADGSVLVTGPAGSSVELTTAGQLKLNGGGSGVARQGDTITLDASLIAWFATVAANITSAGVPTSPPTGVTGSITTSSSTVKSA